MPQSFPLTVVKERYAEQGSNNQSSGDRRTRRRPQQTQAQEVLMAVSGMARDTGTMKKHGRHSKRSKKKGGRY